MSAHLSALELDEVAAGLTAAPPHLAECEACRARLEALHAARAAFQQHPEASRVLARLGAPATPTPLSRRRFVPVLVAGLAFAAGIVLLVQLPNEVEDGTRIKGTVAVELLDEQGQAVSRAPVGQRLTLAASGAGATHVVVFAEDASGARTRLWPADGTTLAPLEPGARVRLMQLEVTPGAVTVIARFAQQAVSVEAPDLVEARLRLEVE